MSGIAWLRAAGSVRATRSRQLALANVSSCTTRTQALHDDGSSGSNARDDDRSRGNSSEDGKSTSNSSEDSDESDDRDDNNRGRRSGRVSASRGKEHRERSGG